MKRAKSYQRTSSSTLSCNTPRKGVTITELLVAATLLVTGLSLVVPVAVRTSRLWRDSSHYQLAVLELQNQLERLTSLEREDLREALENVKVSPAIQKALPNPKINCEQFSDAAGDRLVLSLTWDRRGGGKPITLVGWLPDAFDSPGSEDQEREP